MEAGKVAFNILLWINLSLWYLQLSSGFSILSSKLSTCLECVSHSHHLIFNLLMKALVTKPNKLISLNNNSKSKNKNYNSNLNLFRLSLKKFIISSKKINLWSLMFKFSNNKSLNYKKIVFLSLKNISCIKLRKSIR